MLRLNPIPPRKTKTAQKRDPHNQENIKPSGFSTRPKFNAELPYDSELIKAKEKVFVKYRAPDEECVMLDPKNTHRGALIQRGVALNKEEDRLPLVDRQGSNLLKSYLIRKERRQHYDLEKFQESSKLGDQLTVRQPTQTDKSARGLSSRISATTALPWIDL